MRRFKSKFDDDALEKRAFERISWVLKHYYEEQEEEFKVSKDVCVHSTVFNHLIFDDQIIIGRSEAATKLGVKAYREHVVPCVWIRNLSFEMLHENKTEDDVANMVGKLLKIAFITPDEAKRVDAINKTTMPKDWDWQKDSVKRRLKDAGVELFPLD